MLVILIDIKFDAAEIFKEQKKIIVIHNSSYSSKKFLDIMCILGLFLPDLSFCESTNSFG